MAENKKSFLLYADLIHTVKKMPLIKAGKLLVKILEYVNDLNPKDTDVIVDLVFEPIKQQLKRDLKHWESIKEKRVEAGKLGGIKSGKKRKQNKANEASASKSKQSQANEAVTVNDTVTVNVINDVDYSSSTLFSLALFELTELGENEFTLHATRQTNRSISELNIYKTKFILECKGTGKLSWPNSTDAKKHFINWVKKQPEIQREQPLQFRKTYFDHS